MFVSLPRACATPGLSSGTSVSAPSAVAVSFGPDAARPRLTLWICLWGIFVSNITLTILTVALPSIARDLDSSGAATNWVSLGPMLVVALCTPASGRAADRYGRKRIWLLGFGLSLLGMVASAIAPSLTPLLLARVVTAIGSALLLPAALSITTDLYPPDKRATPIGYWTSAMAISPLAGVLIGGALLDVLSWRWLFVGQVVIGLPALLMAALYFEERKFPQTGGFDIEGSVSIGLSALALMLAASLFGTPSLRLWALFAGLLALVFARWAVSAEARAKQPILPPSLMSEPVVRFSLGARVALTFSYMGAFMILPYLLKEVWHLSALAISTLLVWRPLAMGLTGPLAGRLSARFGAARLVVWGGYCILGSSVAFLWLDAQPNSLLLTLGLGVAGVGLGLCAPGTGAVVVERVGSEMLGTVSSIMTLSSTLANALGMAVMFAVVETSGSVQTMAGYRASFWLGTAVSCAGVAAAHMLQRRAPHRSRA